MRAWWNGRHVGLRSQWATVRVQVPPPAPWRGRQGTPYKAPSKEGALPLYKILATAWSLSIQSVLHRHGVAAEARPTCPPLSRGALPLYKILAGTWSPKHPKCFTPTWRSRQGALYSPPSEEGGLLLHKILVGAWRPRWIGWMIPSCW